MGSQPQGHRHCWQATVTVEAALENFLLESLKKLFLVPCMQPNLGEQGAPICIFPNTLLSIASHIDEDVRSYLSYELLYHTFFFKGCFLGTGKM